MRKNENKTYIEGYVYDLSKIELKVTGEKSKNPGTPFISGDMQIAIDETGTSVIPVHFTYIAEYYGDPKNNKVNKNFGILKNLIEKGESWLTSGMEKAPKVGISGNVEINDFYNRDGELVSAKRVAGSFVNMVSSFKEPAERNTFSTDMLITKVIHVEADAEKNIEEDYTRVGGAIFNFRNELFPVEYIIRNPKGMNYFESLDASSSNPVYTKVWGNVVSNTVKYERTEESAFGDPIVKTYDRTHREWLIINAAKTPYEFGDPEVMTTAEVEEAIQNRDVYLATIKKNAEEYAASKNAPSADSVAKASSSFNF